MPRFSFTLVQKIEAGAEPVAAQIAEEIRRDHHLSVTHLLADREIISRARHLIENFGHWLVAHDSEIEKWAEPLGRTRFEQSIPLHELIRCLQIIERRIIAFARDGMAGTVLEIYAEGELQYRVRHFFDDVTYFAARGYESALNDVISGTGRIARSAGASAAGSKLLRST